VDPHNSRGDSACQPLVERQVSRLERGGQFGSVACVALDRPPKRHRLLDQLARPDLGISTLVRLRVLEGLAEAGGSRFDLVNVAVVVMATVGVAAVVLVARRVPAARMWCALVVVEVGYQLVAPNFYTHYSGWMAPAAAIIVGTVFVLLKWRGPLELLGHAANRLGRGERAAPR